MNEQRRNFLKAGAFGMTTLTLTGLNLIPSVQAVDNRDNATKMASVELPEIEAELVAAPNVPQPIKRRYAAKIIVKLTAFEQIMALMPGVQFKFWTFNGQVPAPLIRVREGDMVEVQLSNSASSMMTHSTDFHAASAPMGALWQVKRRRRGQVFFNLKPRVRGFICTIAAASLSLSI